jgi:MFS family permease
VQRNFARRRGLATGITVAGSGVGGFVLGPLLQALIETSGWGVALAVFGGAATVVLGLACAALAPIVIVAPTQALEEPAGPAAGAGVGTPSKEAADGAAVDSDTRPVDAPTIVPMPLATPGSPAAVDPGRGPAAGDANAAASRGSSSTSVTGSDATGTLSATVAALGGPAVDGLASPASGPTSPLSLLPAASSPAQAPAPPQAASPPPPPPRTRVADLFAVPGFVTYCVFVCLYSICCFTLLTHFATYAAEAGATPAQTGLLVATQGIANTLGRVALGLAADAYRKRTVAILGACVLTVGAMTLGLAAPPGGATLPYAFAYMAVSGALGGSIVSLQPAIVIDLVGMHALPLAQGVFNGVQGPFALAGPPAAGALRVSLGSYSAVFVVLGCVTLAAGGIALGITRGIARLPACCLRGQRQGGSGGGAKEQGRGQ